MCHPSGNLSEIERAGCNRLTAFDYCSAEPCIIWETSRLAAVYKPPRLPTAPLHPEERDTLVYWFLHSQPEGQLNMPPYKQAALVQGKKSIEAGLLHRLDTDTRGLVLFAKDQATYDFLSIRQKSGQIVKTYYAFVKPYFPHVSEVSGKADIVEKDALTQIAAHLPYSVVSQFRNFGPGAKKVAPIFPDSRRYKKEGRRYTTVIEALDIKAPLAGTGTKQPLIGVRCRLVRGYRHQVRAHLASLGLPIAGDPLYSQHETCDTPLSPHMPAFSRIGYGLQLYAFSLSFPDPENPHRNICVALPPPDKMNR